MLVSKIGLKNFKRIEAANIPLTKITALVGGNNSGKSTVLQAAHFGVGLLQALVREANPRISPEKLLYVPTSDVFDVAFGARLGELPVQVTYGLLRPDQDAEELTVSLTAGSDGALDVTSVGPDAAFDVLSDLDHVFSVYVPGLAGIPMREEYRSDGVLRGALARGDANLFLRNVLLRIQDDAQKRSRLAVLFASVFPGHSLIVEYDAKQDQYIEVRVASEKMELPLDMAGTGVLQFLQIAAYAVNYEPSMLLLDEPDAHLHPDNQRHITRALEEIVADSGTRVVLATHSRTMLDALASTPDASVLWLERGVVQLEKDKDHLAMLLGLGALDGAERFYEGVYRLIVFTEDEGHRNRRSHLEAILVANGLDISEVLIQPYAGVSNLESVASLAQFIEKIRPGVPIVIHRDRDFLTEAEVAQLEQRFAKRGLKLFVTDGSDIEASFASPHHLHHTLGISVHDATVLVDQTVADHTVEITTRFVRKRDEIKASMYRGQLDKCPSLDTLMQGNQIHAGHAVGKQLFGWVISEVEARKLGKGRDVVRPSPVLISPLLQDVAKLLAEEKNISGATQAESGSSGKGEQ